MATLSVLAAILTIIALFLLPVVLSTVRKRKLLSNMPGMKEKLILGHAAYYVNKKPHEIVEIVWQSFAECGKIWKMFLLHEVQVVTADPKVCEVSEDATNEF